MKKYILFFISAVIVMTSCKNTKKQAIEFNNKFSVINDSIYNRGRAVGEEINAAMTSHDFSKVANLGNGLEKYVNQKINEVKAMENVAGSENLKAAMLDFLAYEIKISKDAFGPIGELPATATQEEIQVTINNLMDKSKDETTYLQKLQNAQKEFAKANKFEIIPKTK